VPSLFGVLQSQGLAKFQGWRILCHVISRVQCMLEVLSGLRLQLWDDDSSIRSKMYKIEKLMSPIREKFDD
jgi:hypothetical protein